MSKKENRIDEKYQAYEKVPIYRRARDILRQSHLVAARMGKMYKFSLGVKITESASLLAESVFLAYEEKENISAKLYHIERIITHTQSLLISYRVAKDLSLLPTSVYAEVVDSIVCIIRQSKGWEQSTKNKLLSREF